MHLLHNFLISIKSHKKEQIIKSRASKKLKEKKFLLNNKSYISITCIIKKNQHTFWAFRHDKKMVSKLTNTIKWLYDLCKKIRKIQLYFLYHRLR